MTSISSKMNCMDLESTRTSMEHDSYGNDRNYKTRLYQKIFTDTREMRDYYKQMYLMKMRDDNTNANNGDGSFKD